MSVVAILQPSVLSTTSAIRAALSRKGITHLDVAAAYVTSGGAQELLRLLGSCLDQKSDGVEIRVVTAFDYCRTDPLALEMLAQAGQTQLRIHEGRATLARSCNPSRPFHPKVFIFQADSSASILAGSGNLSRSGLRRGYEAGLLISASNTAAATEAQNAAAIAAYKAWYENLWGAADRLDEQLLAAYTQQFESQSNLRSPTITDDDVVPATLSKGQLPAESLRKLRACANFWIEAGNITPNRGQGLPGNQLMMKRLSRVFFGQEAIDVAPNTHLGNVYLGFGANQAYEGSLTFSDNGMDKLTLPIPGAGGPISYDNENLLFRRVRPDRFRLEIGSAAERRLWGRRSRAIDSFFTMSSGRSWGSF